MFLFKRRTSKLDKHSESSDKVYMTATGEYLPDDQQGNPLYTTRYVPHKSTRYKNVQIGSNNLPMNKNMQSGEWKLANRQLPELYSCRENCCSCYACSSICPVKAITMEPDEEGFEYPVIDAAKCIRCFKCDGVCPIKKKIDLNKVD